MMRTPLTIIYEITTKEIASLVRKENSLRGRDLQKILKEEFNARYSLGGTYFLLHRFGFPCLCPRQR